MQLLRDLWKRINPDCALGADNRATEDINKVATAIAARQFAADLDRMRAKVRRLRNNGTMYTLTRGEIIFCDKYKIDIS
jgi:hypothetical protein